MKIFLYRIYSTTLSSYHAYDFTLKADFTKAITAQVSDMAHGSLVILKILGITKSNTESKLKHHINTGFFFNSFSARNNIGKVSFQYYLYFSC